MHTEPPQSGSVSAGTNSPKLHLFKLDIHDQGCCFVSCRPSSDKKKTASKKLRTIQNFSDPVLQHAVKTGGMMFCYCEQFVYGAGPKPPGVRHQLSRKSGESGVALNLRTWKCLI